ncbi:MAG: hypothetical protein GY850_17790 [bacterium]|nr:hypothetical protein [bacterium]
MMKNLAVIVLIALVHFGMSILIVAASMSVATTTGPVPAEPTIGLRILVEATRIIYFPIISLSLYSRQWFPGNWIYVPMLVNSFIWGSGIFLLFMLGKKTMGFRVQRSAFRVIRKRKH